MGRQIVVVDAEKLDGALRHVMDPHFNVSLHDMGMVRGVKTDADGAVEVKLVFPCIGCPAWTLIQNDIKSRLQSVDGVSKVSVKVDWDEDWSREDMSKAARAHAANHGYRI